MRISSSGNVGIGASTVDTKLHVEETTANTGCVAKVESLSWNAGIELKNGNDLVDYDKPLTRKQKQEIEIKKITEK